MTASSSKGFVLQLVACVNGKGFNQKQTVPSARVVQS